MIPHPSLLVVDVQPTYNPWCAHVLPKLRELCEAATTVTWMFNGTNITYDSEEEVRNYIGVFNLCPDDGRLRLVEKEYGFFRGWMDNGVPEHTIIRTLQDMVEQSVYDTRDIPTERLEELLEGARVSDSMYIPEYLTDSYLLHSSAFTTCGGGVNECLKEIELWLAAKNIITQRVDAACYGF